MRRRDLICGALSTAAIATAPQALAQAFQPKRFVHRMVGQGPDVILIPGLMCSGEVWDATVAQISGRRRCHVLTLAGFAGVPAGPNGEGEVVGPVVEEIAALIRAENLKDVSIIGHSVGGLMGQLLAGRHPELVSRVMVVDALPLYWLLGGPTATVERFRGQSAALRDQLLRQTPEQFEAVQRLGVSSFTEVPAHQERIIGWTTNSDRRVGAQVMYEVNTTDARPLHPAIKAKVTVLYAVSRNSRFPAANYDAVFGGAYAGVANRTLRRIDESGHFVMYDQPERFAREVEAFLA